MIAKLYELLPTIERLLGEGGWKYQRVNEQGFMFDRAWRDVDGRRLAVHYNEPPNPLYWHPHDRALGVLILGPGPYELHLARGTGTGLEEFWDEDLRQMTAGLGHTGVVIMSGVAAYAMTGMSWHAVRVHGPCTSIALWAGETDEPKARSITPPPVADPQAWRDAVAACIERAKRSELVKILEAT
jgi:hypothetical protein